MTEKLLSRNVGRPVYRGEYIVAKPDLLMCHDGNRPILPDVLAELGVQKPAHPERMAFVVDHGVPTPTHVYANVQKRFREYARIHGILLSEAGQGISHTRLPELGLVRPGDVILAMDSHTTTMGALNCAAAGVGATDLAMATARGELWLRVPAAIKVVLEGELERGVTARDIALHLLGNFGTNWATYKAIEFAGPGVRSLSMDARFTLTNQGIELGAKFALMPFDEVTERWLRQYTDETFQPTAADDDARYESVYTIHLSELSPLVAQPHAPDNVWPVAKLDKTPIDYAFIGTCASGRVDDLRAAADILRGRRVAPGVRLLVIPGSKGVMDTIVQEGVLQILLDAGAIVSPPGCGPCAGVQGGIPGDSERVISTAPRNFLGRMGNPQASLFLGSAATTAASAVAGYVADPRDIIVEAAV